MTDEITRFEYSAEQWSAVVDTIRATKAAGRYKNQPHQKLTRAWIIARTYGGLDDVGLHDRRHSYASLAASRGSRRNDQKAPRPQVAATTQRYAHLARDAVASVNDELGDLMKTAIEKHPPKAGLPLKAQPNEK